MFPKLLLVNIIIILTYSSILPAQTSFTNVAPSIGINHYHQSDDMGGGVVIFDYNNDTLLDIFYTGGKQRASLYQNNGNGSFTDVTLSANLGFTDSVVFIAVLSGDIDNDGYRELFLMTLKNERNYLLKNNGNGTFSDITASAGLAIDSSWTMSATFGDYDKDGYLDLYLGNYVDGANTQTDSMGQFLAFAHVCYANKLWHNNGNSTFTDVTQTMNVGDVGCNLATTFTDYDNDNDVDIFNANDFGAWIIPNVLLENNYPNSFTDVSISASINSMIYGMGIAVGDYDQDQDLDYYVTNIGRNVLSRNNGDGTFTDTTSAAGVTCEWAIQDSLHSIGWGTGFMDIDNDSYLDLYVANGYIAAVPVLLPSFMDPDMLYHNNGDGTFSNITTVLPIDSFATSRGFAYGDYDNDGDIDLIPIPSLTDPNNNTINVPLFRNNLNNSNNWLKASLQGTISNRDAYGAHIIIYVNGKSWVHEVSGQGSHCSQHSTIAHFGLGTASVVDSLIIQWPNGLVEKLNNISVNQTLYLVEGMVTNIQEPSENLVVFNVFPNPAKENITILYELSYSSFTKLSMTNVLGQVLWEERLQNTQIGQQLKTINAKLYANGIYFVNMETNGTITTQKIIIQQ